MMVVTTKEKPAADQTSSFPVRLKHHKLNACPHRHLILQMIMCIYKGRDLTDQMYPKHTSRGKDYYFLSFSLAYDCKQKKPRSRPGPKKKLFALPHATDEIYRLTCRYHALPVLWLYALCLCLLYWKPCTK